MNFSSIIGFLVAASVLGFAIINAEGARTVLLNSHALAIVLGGTAAAAFVCFPISNILRLTWLVIKKLVGMTGQNYQKIIEEVIGVASAVQTDPAHIKNNLDKIQHPFLREGLQLMVEGVTEDQLIDIMESRIETIHRGYAAEVNMFRTIGKFPPAFGLLGTTFGMIALLNQLGTADAQKMIGPAMAVGLVATLYGISLANFIFIPIAENLNALSAEDFAARKMILEGLLMLKRKTHPILVQEKMKSYLMPAQRNKMVLKVPAAAAAARK